MLPSGAPGRRRRACSSLAPRPSSHLLGQEEHPKAGGPGWPREGGPPPQASPARGLWSQRSPTALEHTARPPESTAPQTHHPRCLHGAVGGLHPRAGPVRGDLGVPQEHYDQLHRKMSHAWDLVVVQAREQLRAAKQCRKGDRLVIACQERTYWLVNRPPTQSPEFYRQEVERCRKALARARVKSSVCLEAYLNFSSQRGPHDPLLSGCLPSNPWVTDEDTYWTVNAPSVAVPTKLRVERWGFSFQELLGDPVGRAHFLAFLGTEFSAENLSFWEACEELRYGGQAQVPALVDSVYQQFLAPGAARWVNVDSRTMERTLAGLRRPHRYVLDDAQLHIYMLMKKDSYPRFLKSAAYRDLLADAVVPAEARRRAFPFLRKLLHPSPSPALLPASTSVEPVAAASDPACGDRGT
ncbi:regulator of G-protein signaling 11 isoform X5 [Vulpes vulpes]|uniref:Regulator of G-protein signaling 11 isoform X5 n=1 Tax=Vulpes vulpes TaxID=9627 RepID=A0ABM5A6I6_VULVU